MVSEAIGPPSLTIDVVADDEVVRVVVTGEVDAATASRLLSCLTQVIDTYRPRLVALDCADLAFLDATGITALIRAHKHAIGHHGEIRLFNTRHTIARLLTLTCLHELFGVPPTK